MSRAIQLLYADQANTKQDFKVDWKENSKLDFILEEPLGPQTITTELDGGPSPSAMFTQGIMYFGTGNPATHYLVKKNETQGLEIAVKVHARGAPGYAVASDVDEDGFHVFQIPALPLLTVTGADPKRSRWNYSFSILAGQAVVSNLTDFTFHLDMDFDPSDAGDQIEPMSLSYGGKGKWVALSTGEQIIDPDSAFDSKMPNRNLLEQNSFNPGIVKVNPYRPLSIDPLWAEKEGFFNFTLTAKMGGKVVLESKVKVHAKPEFVWLT